MLPPAMARAQTTHAQTVPAPAGCTGPASGTWIKVVTEGVRNGSGLVAITLYADDSSRFLVHHGSLYVGRAPATQGTTETCIFVPRPGIYALAIYHDENANQKFDRTGLGLPAEGYGFSNNPRIFVAKPSFNSVKFTARAGETVVHVRLNHT